MWKRMAESWVWIAAVVDLAVSLGVAQLLVHFGVRWSYMAEQPLDASSSILGFTVLFGLLLPLVALFLGAALVSSRSGACEAQ